MIRKLLFVAFCLYLGTYSAPGQGTTTFGFGYTDFLIMDRKLERQLINIKYRTIKAELELKRAFRSI